MLHYDIIRIKKIVLTIIILIILLFSKNIRSDSIKYITINGAVLDSVSHEPLSFTNVFLKHTGAGTVTDNNGYFILKLEISELDTLIISRIGYREKRIIIDPDRYKGGFLKILLVTKPVELERVMVTSDRASELTIVKPEKIVLSSQIIYRLPEIGEADVLRTLTSFPGITYTNDYNAGLYIRGGGREHNLITIDGNPVPSPYHLLGIFSTFDTQVIQNIEVEKDIISSELGNRLSSSINIDIRDGISDRTRFKYSLSLISAKFCLEGPYKYGTYLFSLRNTYIDHFTKLVYDVGILKRPPEDSPDIVYIFPYGFTDCVGKLVFKRSLKHRFEFLYYMNKDYYDFRIIDNSATAGVYRWGNYVLGLKYTGILKPDLVLNTQVSFSNFLAKWIENKIETHINTHFNIAQLSSYITQVLLSDVKLKYGFSLRNYDSYFNCIDLTDMPLTIDIGRKSCTEVFFEISSAQKKFFNPYISISSIGRSRGKFYVNKQFSIKVNPKNDLTLSFNLSNNFQDLTTIYSPATFMILFDAWVPLPDSLPFMSSVNGSIGFSYKGISLTYFDRYFSRLIKYNDEKILRSDPVFVSGSGRSRGIELNISGRFKRSIHNISYTKSSTIVKFNGFRYHPEYDRPDIITLWGSFNLSRRWDLKYRFIYQTGTPITKVLGYYNIISWRDYTGYHLYSTRFEMPIYSKRGEYRLPPYHRLDISFSYYFKIRNKPAEFYIDLINVYLRLNKVNVNIQGDTFIQMPPLITFGLRGEI